MEEQLNYEDRNKYLIEKLSQTKIDPVYHPIIASVIARRSACFNLSDELFKRDVDTFVRNVDCIRISDTELGDNDGGFNQENREIVLNRKIFEQDEQEVPENVKRFRENLRLQKIYQVIAHESTHAMNFEGKEDRTFDSEGVMEAFTNAESDALVYKHPIEMLEGGQVYRRVTEGYTKIEGYVELLAATFGVDRNELLGAAIKGSEELQNLLNGRIELRDEITGKNKIFESISNDISLIHSAKTIENPQDRAEIVMNADKSIYTLAEIGIDNRIANLELYDIEGFRKQFDRIKIEQKIVSSIMKSDVPTKYAQEIKEGTNGKYELVNTKLLCIEEILQDNNIQDKLSLIKDIQGIQDIEEITKFLEENGISIDPNMKLEDTISLEAIDEYNKEHSSMQWDNQDVMDYISVHRDELQNVRTKQPSKFKVFIAKAMGKINGLFDRVGEFANKLFGKEEVKLLPESTQPVKSELKSWDLANYGIDKDEFNEESIRLVEDYISREDEQPTHDSKEESHEIV